MSTTDTQASRIGVHASPYPRFSDGEMQRRHDALLAAAGEQGVEHVVVRGADRSGTAVGWFTRWPVTREAIAVISAGERDVLNIAFYNHIPNATRVAADADVGYIGEDPAETTLAELRRRGAAGKKIGIVGPVGYRLHAALQTLGEVVDLNGAYAKLRLVKSAEEVEWVRHAAALTDAGLEALAQAARPGVNERELGDRIERAYISQGATNFIHYLAATAMDTPGISVPAQYPSDRKIAAGDAVTCEISANFWEYSAQILRTMAVGTEPTPLYAELHAVADAAFDAITGRLRAGATAAELVEASGVIEDAGFTIRDDLVHGYVGGYWAPVLGTASRQIAPVPDFTYEAGMMVVVQPNVVTPDESAGVQTGELLLVTEDGVERMHSAARGLRVLAI